MDRQEIVTPIVHPEKRDHEWYLPAQPIARAVHAELFFDPVSSSVSVSNALDASFVEYDGVSGEVRRNQALDLALAPGLAVGSSEADLRLPLSLVTLLFDLRAHVRGDESEITLLSRGPGGLSRGLPTVGMQELRYHGYGNRNVAGWDGGLRIDNDARLGRGRLHSSVFAQAADSVSPLLRAYTFDYLDGHGNEFGVGDLRGTPDFRWLDSFGRGAKWAGERGDGLHRFSVDFRRLVSGQTGAPGRASRPTFEGEVASVAYTHGARAGAPAGQALSAGLAVKSDAREEPGGVLFAAQHRHASPRLRTQAMTGLFRSPGRRPADGLAGELNVEWRPTGRLRLNTRLGHYGTEFRLPVPDFTEKASRFWTIGGGGSPLPGVSLSASHTIREVLPRHAVDDLTTASASFATGKNAVRTVSVSLHASDVAGLEPRNDLLVDVRGGAGRYEWFLMTRETVRDGYAYVGNAGVSTRTRFGSGQLAGTWQEGRLEGFSLHWAQPIPGRPQLYGTFGGRWGRPRSDEDLDFLASVRLTYDFAGTHGVDYSYDQHRSHDASRLAWHGAFRFDEGRARHGPFAAPRPHVAEIRGRVYLDEDLDGAFGKDDVPLPGLRVRLDRGHLWAETDAAGEYSFRGIGAGRHTVSIAAEMVRADLALLDPIERETRPGAFRTESVDWRVSRARTLHGLVFLDLNANGKPDDREPGLANVRVLIAGGRDTVSDSNGTYRLSDVPPGVHSLVVDQASLAEDTLAPDPIEVRLAAAGDPLPVPVPVRPREREVERRIFVNP